MPNYLDNATRRKIIDDWLDTGDTYMVIAERRGVTRRSVSRVVDDFEVFGTHERQQQPAHLRRIDAVIDPAGMLWINAMVHAHPVMYAWHYVEVYNHHHPGSHISLQNFRDALKVLWLVRH